MSDTNEGALAPAPEPEAPKPRSRAAKKAAAATPPPIEGMKVPPPPVDDGAFTSDQQRRLEALRAAKELLGRDVTAGELLDLAIYVEVGMTNLSDMVRAVREYDDGPLHEEDREDEGPSLTFTPHQEGTHQ